MAARVGMRNSTRLLSAVRRQVRGSLRDVLGRVTDGLLHLASSYEGLCETAVR